jgi:ketosteroid isomerase-like protein
VGCVLTKEEENLEIVKHLFEKVEEGNVPAALKTLADEVYWQSPVTRTSSIEISWSKPRHNRKEVATFFKELREKMTPEKFEFLNFIAQGDHVVVEGKNRGTVVSTGNEYEHDWVMKFELRDKKIIRYLHYYDTADLSKCFH